MATIALYADKINQMPGLIRDVKKSVLNYKAELSALKNKSLKINQSICNMDDVVSSIQASSQTQEEKAASLEAIQQNSKQFIEDTAHIDSEVADAIRQRKDDFYEQYYYLKPECEKNGWEKFCDWCKKAGAWCREHWKAIVTIFIVITAIVILVACPACGAIIAGACWGAITGAVSGGLMGGISSVLSGGSFWAGVEEGAFSGAVTGAIFGGLGGAGQVLGKSVKCASTIGKIIKTTSKVSATISGVMGLYDTAAFAVGLFAPDCAFVKLNQQLHSSKLYNGFQMGVSALAIFTGSMTKSMTCFVAGTLILTTSGLVAIEHIKAGDKVISTNPETNETAEKTVLETYIREDSKLIHLTINGEKIVTTESHPFYVNDQGFVNAGELAVGDELIDFRGNVVYVEDIFLELSQKPTTVYNFQVEDFHTYYVGRHCIFVHNADCGGRYADLKKTSDSSKEQVHHIPADAASPLSKSDGVAIKMDISDHKKTASFDNKPGSRAYRRTQARLISEGKFQEAFNMDVADITSKFPGKYDDFISQAQSYLNELMKAGKVK